MASKHERLREVVASLDDVTELPASAGALYALSSINHLHCGEPDLAYLKVAKRSAHVRFACSPPWRPASRVAVQSRERRSDGVRRTGQGHHTVHARPVSVSGLSAVVVWWPHLTCSQQHLRVAVRGRLQGLLGRAGEAQPGVCHDAP